MSNGNDRTPVLQNEDWWACFIGWFILLLAIIGVHEAAAGKWAVSWLLPHTPKLGTWTSLADAFPNGFGVAVGTGLLMWAFITVLTIIGGYFMKYDIKGYIPGFLLIYIITFVSMVISKQAFIKKWGISYVLFALAIGLIISNIFKVPKIMKAAGQTEFFVKIGLSAFSRPFWWPAPSGSGLIIFAGHLRYPSALAVLSPRPTRYAVFPPVSLPVEPFRETPRKSAIWWPGCWCVRWY